MSFRNLALVPCFVGFACQTANQQNSSALQDDSTIIGPADTASPYLAFQCADGDFIYLGTQVSTETVAITEIGFPPSTRNVLGMPLLTTPMSAPNIGVRLDFCVVGEEPRLRRVVVVESTARPAAPGTNIYVKGEPLTMTWIIDDSVTQAENR